MMGMIDELVTIQEQQAALAIQENRKIRDQAIKVANDLRQLRAASSGVSPAQPQTQNYLTNIVGPGLESLEVTTGLPPS